LRGTTREALAQAACAALPYDVWPESIPEETRVVPIETVAECVAEAIRLLADASKAASDDERLRLLRRSTAWLQIAKQRAPQAGAREAGTS